MNRYSNTMKRLATFFCMGLFFAQAAISADATERTRIEVTSSLDGTRQPSYLILPDGFDQAKGPVPLLVSLHTWSNGVEQCFNELEAGAAERGWIYLFPHFRGPNRRPEACGSELARQDVLDAVEWVLKKYPIDRSRIYLTGVSGGGHMTMLLSGYYPERWSAASAWVGIADLARWERRHHDGRYGQMVRASCGGLPGDSAEVDRQYRMRSPVSVLGRAVDLPLDLNHGIHDGYKGSVPVWHSLTAFNVVAKAVGGTPVSEAEMAQVGRENGRLDHPTPTDQIDDPAYGRAIYLRRTAKNARVTLFDGGHERLPAAALAWLEKKQRPTRGWSVAKKEKLK